MAACRWPFRRAASPRATTICPRTTASFSCLDHPDGLLMRTRESEDFLVLNGIQTQSARVHNLIAELRRLA